MGLARNLANLRPSSAGLIEAGDLDTSASQLLGMRNRLINGSMIFDQRNGGAQLTYAYNQSSTNKHAVDRWATSFFGFSSGNLVYFQQVSDAPAGFKKSLKITSISGLSSSSGLGGFIVQPIEGNNLDGIVLSTGFEAVTVSFWVKASRTGTMSLCVEGTGAHYTTPVTINATGTWEYKTVSFPASAIGSIPTDNTTGLNVLFGVISNGSWLTGTANQWNDDANRAVFVSNQTNFLQSANDYIAFTGAQFEKGSVATPFEHRPYGLEETLCKRYFEVVGIYDYPESGTYYAGWKYLPEIRYQVQKRANPTATTIYQSGWPNGAGGSFSASPNTISITVIGQSGNALNNNLHNYGFNISAEL